MASSFSEKSTDPPVVNPSTKPSQIKFFRSFQMALFARVTTYPPLGQVTVVPPSRKQFSFTVVVESSRSLPDRPWEVSIWYDHGSYSQTTAGWRPLDLEKVAIGPTVLLDERSNSVYRYAFEGNLPSPFPDNGKMYRGRKIPFTVRYRIDSHSEWQWVGDNFGVGDGFVILQPPVDPNFLGAAPVEVTEGWHARKLNSEAPGARLYMMEHMTPIPATTEGESKQVCRTLGYTISPCRWFALERTWEPWLGPKHGKESLRLDKPAVLLSFLRSDGQHVVLLPVNGVDDCLTTFSSDENGHIVCCAKNDTGKERKFRVLAAMAWSFELANASVMYELRKMIVDTSAYQETLQSLQGLTTEPKTESVGSNIVLVSTNGVDQAKRDPNDESDPTPQWMQEWYDNLAYCTWNSLGQDLHVEKILQGLKSLSDNDIHITSLIIDDNWQSLTGIQGETSQFERGWTDFEANKKGFPDGLKGAIDMIRGANPKLRDIAVWHALLGYWGCISPDTGHIKDDYKLREVIIRHQIIGYRKQHIIDPSDIHKMYDDFYSFLSKCGITSVKTDAQFFIDLLGNTEDRREVIQPYQSAWTQAHLRHLSGKAISCMSQIPQILFHSFLPTNSPRIMLRNSDDFFPDVEKSHPWHVFCNAHNAVLVQHLNVLPDWDMFQTSHPWSGFHAAARCISGGPIYITDTPGEHNIDLIHQMTAITPRGDTVVLRPSTVAKTLGVYDSYEEGSVLKIGSYDGRAEVGTGIMGVFNVSDSERTFVIPVSKIPGVQAVAWDEDTHHDDIQLVGRRKWIVRSHVSRTVTSPIQPTIPPRGDSLLECTLPQRGYDIWSALPIRGPFPLPSSNLELAILGLLGKMTGACAILNSTFALAENHRSLHVKTTLKALGTLGIWISDGASRTTDNLMVLMHNKPISADHVMIVSDRVSPGAGVVKIDIAKAWDELGEPVRYANEVVVEVVFQ